jgi:predicted RNA-binding Zn-ribbon protein involved in translation (DUF1610 family)
MIGLLLKQEIEHTFQVVPHKSGHDELVFLCPECGDKTGHRSVNLRTGQTFCFRCNKGQHNKGSFLAWANALGYTFANEVELSSIPLRDLLAPVPIKSLIPAISKVKLPRGFTPLTKEPKCVYTKLITDMAVRKNLDYDAFVEAGVGFTRIEPRWEPFAIFPVREYDLDVYYQGRTYIDVPEESTKLFPSRSDVKYGAAFWVYNLDELRSSRASIAVVVESVLNVLSLRRKFREIGCTDMVPVCVFKHHISNVQLLKLIRCTALKEVCLLFDHDAIEATWRLVSTLTNRKIGVTVAEMPLLDGNKKLDPNDNADAALEAIDQRIQYDYGMAVVKEREDFFARHVFKTAVMDMRGVSFSKARS